MRTAHREPGGSSIAASPDSHEPPELRMPETVPDRIALAQEWFDWHPHPGQRKWFDLRDDQGNEPQTLIAACGRRWGKTEAISADVAVRLLIDSQLGQLLVAPTQDQATGLFDAVTEKLQSEKLQSDRRGNLPQILADLEVKRSPYPYIRRKSDGAILLSARSAGRNGRNLRGKGTTRRLPRFRVIVDEAAFVPDEAIERALRPMLATVPGGGQLVMISSPNGKRGAFYEAYCKGERQESGYRSIQSPSSENPLVDTAYLDEMRREMTERTFRAEFLGQFTDAAGMVFPEDDIEAAGIDDDYGSAPLAGMRYVAGVDFGRRGDYTVCMVAEISPAGIRIVDFLRLQSVSWTIQIERVCDLLEKWRVCAVTADATGIGDAVVEALSAQCVWRRLRIAVEEFVFSSATKNALIDNLALSLAQHRLRFPRYPDLLSELRNFEVIGRTSTGRDRMEAVRGHDDAVISLALTHHAAIPFLARSRSGAIIGSVAGKRWSLAVNPSRNPSGTGDDKELFSNASHQRLQKSTIQHSFTAKDYLLAYLYQFAPCRVVGSRIKA